VDTRFALNVRDEVPEIVRAPIFGVQKPAGSDVVLLPVIDFLVCDFYIYENFDDPFTYDQKSTSAIFVGSTTGCLYTEEIVRSLAAPRLRAAVYFKNKPRVHFLLPQITQCNSKETEELLRKMGFGNGPRIPWKSQMAHKFIISMDGNGATCSRVVIALKSNSVLLKYNSPHRLYYFSHLIPWQHYIPIETDRAVESIVQMDLDCPGLFRFIADEGCAFAERYLTKEAVTRYAAELIRFYAEMFSPAAVVVPSKAVEANAPLHRDKGDDTMPLSGFRYMGHVENRGDTWAQGGEWLGETGSKRWIEGIMLPGIKDGAGVSYQAVLQDGSLTDPIHHGEFCGSRGRHLPICGFRIILDGNAAKELQCAYSATFVDGSIVGPVQAGQVCRAKTLAPLESFQIELQPIVSHHEIAGQSAQSVAPSGTAGALTEAAGVVSGSKPPADHQDRPAGNAAGVLRRVMVNGFARVSPLLGVPYLEFLKALHVQRQVKRYLEIGTNTGSSLSCATHQAVAIDPSFRLDKATWAAKPGVTLFEMTSDKFFATHDPRDVLGGQSISLLSTECIWQSSPYAISSMSSDIAGKTRSSFCMMPYHRTMR